MTMGFLHGGMTEPPYVFLESMAKFWEVPIDIEQFRNALEALQACNGKRPFLPDVAPKYSLSNPSHISSWTASIIFRDNAFTAGGHSKIAAKMALASLILFKYFNAKTISPFPDKFTVTYVCGEVYATAKKPRRNTPIRMDFSSPPGDEDRAYPKHVEEGTQTKYETPCAENLSSIGKHRTHRIFTNSALKTMIHRDNTDSANLYLPHEDMDAVDEQLLFDECWTTTKNLSRKRKEPSSDIQFKHPAQSSQHETPKFKQPSLNLEHPVVQAKLQSKYKAMADRLDSYVKRGLIKRPSTSTD